MRTEFKHIPGLGDLCEFLRKDEDDVDDLAWLIGRKKVQKASVLDILVEVGMVESKNRFRKNPQTVTVNGEKVALMDYVPKHSGFVLGVGKGSSLKCHYIEFI